MTDCKHNWQFTDHGTGALKCTRCGTVTGPKPYDQRVKDFLQEPWTTEQLSVPAGQTLSIGNIKPNYNITFHNQDGKQIGVLNFNGPEMTFTGDADDSAKVFFEFIANAFKARLEQERADEREACAKVADDLPAPDYVSPDDVTVWDVATLECGDAIRARGSNT